MDLRIVTDPSLDGVFRSLPASMSVRQVAELLNTSERTVLRALSSTPQKIPGYKPFGEWVIFRDQLRHCLEKEAAARRNPPSE